MTKSGPDLVAIISGSDRAEFFRDAMTAALEAMYGGTSAPGGRGDHVVPIQAVGTDDESLVRGLVTELADAAARAEGVLRPPRWVAFDEARATANLEAAPGTSAPHRVRLSAWARSADGVALTFSPADTH